MGCGASKNQESVVAPAQAIEKTSLVAQDLAAAPRNQGCVIHDSIKEQDAVLAYMSGSKASDMEDIAVFKSTDMAQEEPKGPSQKTFSVLVLAEPQCVEQEEAVPERPASALPERPASAESDNPARAAFRARFSARYPEELSSSPIAFKSSRSLNRSIGVRRRTSEAASEAGMQLDVPSPALAAPEETAAGSLEPPSAQDWRDETEDEDKGPDPLREHFELTKEQNPLLAIGRKSTTNGILSCKASEKSLKSHKRVAVGFALDDGCDAGEEGVELEQPACGGGGVPEGPTLLTDSASSLDTRELNPEDHMELEHMASVSAMLEQRTMPVVVKLTSP